MKKCSHCGEANADSAVKCSRCGTEFRATPPIDLGRWDRVAVLRNEVEAEHLDVELNNQQIPHVLASYADSALDGLYQTTRGWGHVEAPNEHRKTVLSILEDIRTAAAEPEETLQGKPAGEAPRPAPNVEPDGPRKLCVSCRASIPEDALLCPQCGYTQPEIRSAQSPT